MTTNFFSPLSFVAVLDPESEIRDLGGVKIGIRDKHPGSATLVADLRSVFSIKTVGI